MNHNINKANVFVWTGRIGMGAITLCLLLSFTAVSQTLAPIAGLVAIVGCWILLFTRNADEFTRGLWNSAASLAFASLLILIVVLPFFEGVYAGFTGSTQDEPTWAAIIGSAIVAFYIGLLWKTLRGDA